ncbi:alpha,alpha-trehalose-phosphate synthase (UDP-forming) [Neorhizobium huautlense]|uniref:alpha,alpha-trehalose-phosphate synthase (UDP-forming) n=1 Tax=Neorhizobium huautlense TaxID=67774 RepID=UPI000CF926D4|nr:trehalose-6-phosphate synthase [Neorhizobium huautlense]
MTGGLAASLLSIVEHSGAIWVGCSGSQGDGRHGNASVQTLGTGALVTLDLPAGHYDRYYEGFSNSTLWPAFHSLPNLMQDSQGDYQSYCEINALMAQALHQFRDRNAFWVHDYHFLVLGAELRKLGIDRPIGFFLHTPWPPLALMKHVPHHGELIESMLAYDLIGFQTEGDRQNFLASVGSDLGLGTEDGGVISHYGLTRCQVFPIGIDPDKFAQHAANSSSHSDVAHVTHGLSGEKLAIGVDRLDHTKGIPERIEAFAHHWSKNPRTISLLQIANPSRTGIQTYRDLQDSVGQLVADVNRKYGAGDWTPIRYVTKSFGQDVLSGLYRTAQVGVVTPLRDGMNLVAKEYVAAQNPNDPGVLILSKFAGAADELDTALLVDPTKVEEMVCAISTAIAMPREERVVRWRAMMTKIRQGTVHRWAADFVSQLEKSRLALVPGKAVSHDGEVPSGSKRREADEP